MKWTKFTDSQPSDDVENIWMTDFKIVWIRTRDFPTWAAEMRNWGDDLNKCGWIAIEEPELPKKPKNELHRCYPGSQEGEIRPFVDHFACEEENGELYFGLKRDSTFSPYCAIKRCPWCGYSVKEK